MSLTLATLLSNYSITSVHDTWFMGFFKLKAQLALPIDSAVCRTACNVLSVATEAESRRKRGSKKKNGGAVIPKEEF